MQTVLDILKSLARLVPWLLGFWAGQRRQREVERVNAIKEKQLEVSQHRPRNQQQLIDRLRNDAF